MIWGRFYESHIYKAFCTFYWVLTLKSEVFLGFSLLVARWPWKVRV